MSATAISVLTIDIANKKYTLSGSQIAVGETVSVKLANFSTAAAADMELYIVSAAGTNISSCGAFSASGGYLVASLNLNTTQAWADFAGINVRQFLTYTLLVYDKTNKNVLVQDSLAVMSNVYGAITTATLYDADSLYIRLSGGTQVTLTDNTTTNITMFDKTLVRGTVIEFTIVGASGMRQYTLKLAFFGSTAYDDGGSYIECGTAFSGTIVMYSDISSNSVRLNFVLSGVGENLKLVYKISKITL